MASLLEDVEEMSGVALTVSQTVVGHDDLDVRVTTGLKAVYHDLEASGREVRGHVT